MKLSRSIAALTIGAAAIGGAIAPASAETPLSSLSEDASAPQQYEEHRFSGSSTSVQAFQAWFDGGDFVQPTIETMDLRRMRVNDTQVAEPGDIIYKDENGDFWVK